MANNIVKPSTLPGFLELLPADQIAFNHMLDIIRKNYERCGFIPVDTPVIEKSEVLLAKGGGDTEKQIYRFNKGDTDMSLRFDLTVPLARYVAQHFSELNFPFRRYHIGKVYRGERNQRGRFREFYQCDIDIIGNGKLSIMNDAEIPSIIYSTFKDLGFSAFTIHINNRKVLNGFFKALGIENKVEVLRIVDKLDKIGEEVVRGELIKLLDSQELVDQVMKFISFSGNNEETLDYLKELKLKEEEFVTGVSELSSVIETIEYFGVPEKNYKIDLKIARGLDYYTGTIYETTLDNYPSIGSVCSGGRYDNLAEYYTNQKLPGVGISIGLSRLFYQLKEANLIHFNTSSTLSKVLLIPMEGTLGYTVTMANMLRDEGIVCEVYYEDGKMGKKFGYADKLQIPYTIVIGEDEMNKGVLTLKDMKEGSQCTLSLEEVIDKIKTKNQ